MKPSILITGSTGTLGSALYRKLKDGNTNVVAAARNVNSAKQKLGEDAEVVPFDFADQSTYENAIKNVDSVFIVGPTLNLQVDQLIIPFLDFLKANGILRIVYISAMGLDKIPELPFHSVIEKKLADDSFAYTVLRPTFFAENFKNFEWENITERGIIYTTGGTGKTGFVAVDDIVNVAATVLTEQGHEHKIYELTGTRLYSYDEVASLLTEITGKQVVYPNPTPEEFKSVLHSAGAPAMVADYMNLVYRLIRDNQVNYLTDTVTAITGKRPMHLKAVLERDFQAVVA
jgi:uncharacterized protein YbjT (DUF2867 family)